MRTESIATRIAVAVAGIADDDVGGQVRRRVDPDAAGRGRRVDVRADIVGDDVERRIGRTDGAVGRAVVIDEYRIRDDRTAGRVQNAAEIVGAVVFDQHVVGDDIVDVDVTGDAAHTRIHPDLDITRAGRDSSQ